MFRFNGISKAFGPVRAVDGVDLEIRRGEVTALLGENGAGKSTLMKLLYGVYVPDAGTIDIDGEAVVLSSPAVAIAKGIGMVFQQFTLIPALTVFENLLLSWPRTGWWLGGKNRAVLERLRALAPSLDPARRVADLAVGERQLVELARVLNMNTRCVILDEPTSVLTPLETENFYGLIRPLAEEGRAVVLISHKMADVAACADRVVVMRRGKVVDSARASERSRDQLVREMMGESQNAGQPTMAPPTGEAREAPSRVALELPSRGAPESPARGPAKVVIRGLSAGSSAGSARDLDLELATGEILGVAGVAGNGQRPFAEALTGVIEAAAGEVVLDGEVIVRARAGKSIDARIAYIPEQPRDNAVAAGLPITVNLALRRLRAMPMFPDWMKEERDGEALMRHFDVRPANARLAADALSGGNLQKLVVARELSRLPQLIVACYPTMGLDVAATHAIHRYLVGFSQQGACVLWFSEDLDELMLFADRIAVMRDGRIAGILPKSAVSRQELGRLMAGSLERAAVCEPL